MRAAFANTATALLLALAAATGLAAQQDETQRDALPDFSEAQKRRLARLSPLPPLPPDPTNAVGDDPRAARLGQFLFFDPRLSANGEISCATCHDPQHGFRDQRSLAQGLGLGTRSTPGLWNVAYQRWFFWDGRADSLWSQALGPLENPIEMGTSRLALAHLVRTDAELRAAYEELFGPLPDLEDTRRFPPAARPHPAGDDDPLDDAWRAMAEEDRHAANTVFTHLGKALAAYERRLVTTDAPFDRFVAGLLAGDAGGRAALSAAAQRGAQLFVGKGRCILCHFGPSFSDLEFHNTSAPPLAGGTADDPGRYAGARAVQASPFNAAGAYSDAPQGTAAQRVRQLRLSSESWGEFKTPGLREVARGGPYMHQGQLATLEDVLRFYSTLEDAAGRSHHQEQILVPLRLTDGEISDLLAFLESLSGRLPDPDWLSPAPSPRR